MTCSICRKRKATRYCPAKSETICSVCCATEREVTIDCPSDCQYLVASRRYEEEHRKIDPTALPFPEARVAPSAFTEHEGLISALMYEVCDYARENPSLIDSDVAASLQALAETYRTLARGIYYENPPDHRVQRELYESLKAAIEDYKRSEAQRLGVTGLREETIRDALIVLAQLGATYSNGRPKGRAYLDFLRNQFPSQEFRKPASSIVLP